MPVIPESKIEDLKIAFREWKENRVYLGGAGYYRYKDTRKNTPWTGMVQEAFPSVSDFAGAADDFVTHGTMSVGTVKVTLAQPKSAKDIAQLFTIVSQIGGMTYMGAAYNGLNGYRFMFRSHEAHALFTAIMRKGDYDQYTLE